MSDECRAFSGVCIVHEEIRKYLKIAKDSNCHMLIIHPDIENKLITEVILFMEPALSFSVLISENASKFYDSKKSLAEIIEIETFSS